MLGGGCAWARLGLPGNAGGIGRTGGRLAKVGAVVTARRERLPPDLVKGVIYTSEEAHHLVLKAALLAGFLPERVRMLPSDERFPKAALVVCPNLTIKERLQVLRTDTVGGDYYSEFDIMPPQCRDLLRVGRVLITNGHGLAPGPEQPQGEKASGGGHRKGSFRAFECTAQCDAGTVQGSRCSTTWVPFPSRAHCGARPAGG